jgi:diguanylate cyclase (GGDEF)-like protein
MSRPQVLASLTRLRPSRSLLAAGLAALGLFGVMVWMLVELRRDAWRSAETHAQNLVNVIQQDIERTIETYDLSLVGVIEGLARPNISTIAPDLRKAVLFDRSLDARYFGIIIVLDPAGNVILQSNTLDPVVLNNADRDYFAAHRDRTDVGLYTSRPYISRLSGEPVIALSRRVSNPDGSFAGVVAGTLRLAYFKELLGKVDIGSGGAVNLFRRDGTLLMRAPYVPDTIGRSIAGSKTYRSLTESRRGTFVAHSAIDGVKRLYAFSHLTAAPMMVDVAISVNQMLASWWQEAALVGFSVLGLCLTTIVLMARSEREVRRRTAVEAELNAAVAELGRLAETDGLTGLANRRRFDRVLDRELARARREAEGLSLVMLDADCFKAYNDRYGHQAGDAVLVALASAIRTGLLRPGDLGCRIGGEEFGIILPGTDERGARQVARSIQRAVAAAQITHEGSPFGRVTVSIGIACVVPNAETSPGTLYRSADAALYEAKASGRNTIRSTTLASPAPARQALAG